MTIPKLIQHLLDNRYRLTDQVIVDCLVLATASIPADRRIQPAVLQEILACGSSCHVSLRIGKLKARGLIDYQAGVPGRPGYLIRRVGPGDG